MKTSRMVAMLVASFWVSAAPQAAAAAPDWACLEPVLAQELQGKLDHQDAWAQAISDAQPDLTEFANLVTLMAKTNFEVSRAKVHWLWQTDPDRFDHRDAFFVYSMNDAEMAAWLAQSAQNAQSQEALDDLTAQLRGHPDAESYGSFVAANMRESPFLELAETFGAQNTAQRDLLETCF